MSDSLLVPNRGRLLTGTAADGQLRWTACQLTGVIEHTRLILDLSPLATVAFGRALAASSMLLRLVTKRPKRLSLDLRGAGPLGRVLAECDSGGSLRGIVGERHAVGEGGVNDLRVGPAIGLGLLIVRREESDGQNYESRVVLADGEIGTDVAHYLQQSEQRQSAVLLGVHLGPEGVTGAGGLILEALPAADVRLVEDVEAHLAQVPSVSSLATTSGVESIVEALVGPWSPRVLEELDLKYDCGCTREALVGSLAGLPTEEIQSLVAADGTLDAECGYCGRTYRIGMAETLGKRAN